MSAKQYETLDNTAMTQLAHQALRRYPASVQGDIRLLCRSENATFRVSAGTQNFALRLHRGNYHHKKDIESELNWLDALQEAGIQVPRALSTSAGERVQTLTLDNQQQRHAVLFHWIEGEMPTTSVDARAFRQLGHITAQLHQHSRGWKKPDGFQRIIWDHHSMVGPHSHWGDWRDLQGLDASGKRVVEETLAQVNARMTEYGKDPQRYGLIHADLRLTNLLHHQGETRVIDFDDCGMGWYLHDLAAAISFVEHHPNAGRWIENWLQGYEEVAHISDDDRAILPSMLIQRRIQLTAWAASHRETEMAQSLGDHWARDTIRLCRRYLESDLLPVGA